MLALAILWLIIILCLFTIPPCIIQLQLASLKESKQKTDQAIDTLQKTIDQRETEIQHLSQQIAAKEDRIKQQTDTLDAVELDHMLELEHLKMKLIELEHERNCARTAAELAQKEARLYAEALLRAREV